jgi:heavy metal sensor kinase
MSFERFRSLAGTLRFRLTAWTCLVVFVTVLITLLGVREGVRHSLLVALDEQLREDIEEVRLSVHGAGPRPKKLREELALKAQGHASHGWFAQVFSSEGEMVWSTGEAPELSLAVRPTNRIVYHSTADYRIAQTQIASADTPTRIVRIGTSLAPVDEEVQQLTNVLITSGIVALVLIPLIAYWLAGRATRPLAQIIATAAQLRPSSLQERLPIRNTGDELDKLSQTINGLLDRIAAYIDQNRDYLANAAHELRSPLAAIRSSVEVTLNSDRSVKEYTALLGDIAEECNDMSVLVSQLLLLAEGERGRMAETDQTNCLAGVVRQSLAMFQGVAESQGVNLRVERLNPVQVRGERHYLRQVVNNLIDNAIKFTPAEGQVVVDLDTDATRAFALLRIADTGIGIAPEHLPRLFERFFRCDRSRSRETARRGSGLGLSICESIVKSLAGEIRVTSTLGRGTEFSLLLPVVNKNALIGGAGC